MPITFLPFLFPLPDAVILNISTNSSSCTGEYPATCIIIVILFSVHAISQYGLLS